MQRPYHLGPVLPGAQPPEKKKKCQMGEVVQESVNDTTRKLVPTEPPQHIGKVLLRPFPLIASSTPEDQEIWLSKVDLLDGFCRLLVEPAQKWNVCYMMPAPPEARVRIVVPSVLQMG